MKWSLWTALLLGLGTLPGVGRPAAAEVRVLRSWPAHQLWRVALIDDGTKRGCAMMNVYNDNGHKFGIALTLRATPGDPKAQLLVVLMDSNADSLRGQTLTLGVDDHKDMATITIRERHFASGADEINSVIGYADPKKLDRYLEPALETGGNLYVKTATVTDRFELDGFDSAKDDEADCMHRFNNEAEE
jgi:hypothetical protein